jgi:hypothetical protein
MSKSETCRVHDTYVIKTNEAQGNEDEKKKMETEHMLRLDWAKEMQESLKIEPEQSRDNPELALAVGVEVLRAVISGIQRCAVC